MSDKELFKAIMIETYSEMDETLKSYVYSGFNQYGTYWGGISSFFGLFGGSSNEVGVHFTLNQDILLERARVSIPLGITAIRDRQYWDNFFSGQIRTDQRITLHNDFELEDFKTKHLLSCSPSYYIKLHGSHGWLSYTGKEQIVIGKNKLDDIAQEPVLKWYFDLFNEAINREGVKLFIIGYSFRDKHINDCIINAIEHQNLKIYIISPESPELLRDRLEGKIANGSYEVDTRSMKIWNAIHGYYPYKLADIFPYDQTDTQVAKNLRKLLSN